MFGTGKRKKTSLKTRVNKLQRRYDKKVKIEALKKKEAELRKKLRGY